MANVNAPFGLRAAGLLSGGPLGLPKTRLCFVPASDATAIFIGDPVKTVPGLDSATGCPIVTRSTANTDVLRGVCVGVVPVTSGVVLPAVGILNRRASTAQYILVVEDPHAEFEIQSDATGILANVASMGSNLDYSTAGSAVTGLSGVVLSSTVGTSSKQMRIIEHANIVGNAIGARNIVRVKINLHEFLSTTAP